MGLSPNRLGLGNWLLAALLASVTGVLVSPMSGVNPFNYTLFVVPALAAALAGRLRSIGVALGAGIAIGMFEGLAVHLVSERMVPDALLSGLDSVVPFVAIVLVLVALGRSVPDRGTILDRFPDAPFPPRRPVATVVAVAIAVWVLAAGDSALRLAADHVDDGDDRVPVDRAAHRVPRAGVVGPVDAERVLRLRARSGRRRLGAAVLRSRRSSPSP